jgi:hypothetical protein
MVENMTRDNSNPDNSRGDSPGQPPAGPVPPRPKPRKRRLWLKIVGGVVVLIVLLIVLLPTIASTGMVRSLVVNQVNGGVLNGKLEIKDWSFGWFGGQRIDGIRITDTNEKQVAQVGQISTGLSLLKALTGNLDLGDVQIKDVDFSGERYPDGQINFAKLLKPSNKPPNNQPSKLPNIKGVIHLTNCTGTFQVDADGQTITRTLLAEVKPINATIAIPDINQPIQDSVEINLRLENQTFGAIKINGTVAAITKNLVDTDHLSADQTVELADMDLSPLSPVLAAMKPPMGLRVTGVINGKVHAKLDTLNNINADGAIAVANLSAGGPQLKGDTVAYKTVQLNLNASVAPGASGSPQIKLDLPITAQPVATTQPDRIAVSADVPQDALMQTAQTFQAVLARFAKTPATAVQQVAAGSSGSGSVRLLVELSVANLLDQLPNTVHLEQGASLASGRLTQLVTLSLAQDQAVVTSRTDLTDFNGARAGKPIQLTDLHATVSAQAVGGNKPDIRQVKLAVSSAIFTVDGGGQNLGQTSFSGSFDFSHLQQQVSQIIDLDALVNAPAGTHFALSGTGKFHAHTDGDLTTDNSVVKFGADMGLNDLKLSGLPGRRPIEQPSFNASISGDLQHTVAQFVAAIQNLAVTVKSPAINFATNADVDLGGKFGASVPDFEISRGEVDLHLLQDEFGGALALFVPVPKPGEPASLMQMIASDRLRILSGKLVLDGKGRFDASGWGFERPLSLRCEPVELTVADEMGAVQTVKVPQLQTMLQGGGTVSDQNVATVKNLTATTTLGSPDAPIFALAVAADLTVNIPTTQPAGVPDPPAPPRVTASRLELTRCDGDLPQMQSALGPLLPLILPPPPASSPAATRPSVITMIAQNNVVVSSGKLSASMLASFDGTTLTITRPLTVSVTDLTVHQTSAGGGATAISDKSFSTQIGGSIAMANGGLQMKLQTLSLNVGQELAIRADPAAPVDLSLSSAGALAARGEIDLTNADIPQLLAMGGPFFTPDMAATLGRLSSAQAKGTIKFQATADGGTSASIDLGVEQLTYGKYLNNEKIHLTAGAVATADQTAVHDANLNLDTSFGNVNVSGGQFLLARREGDRNVPVGPLDMVQSLDIAATQIDLVKLYGLEKVTEPATATPAAAATPPSAAAPPPPMELLGGIATMNINLRRQGDTLSAAVNKVIVHNLSVQRGREVFSWPRDFSAEIAAAAQTKSAPPDASILQQLVKVVVNTFNLDTGVSTITLAKGSPIVLQNLGDPSQAGATGGIVIDGDVEPLARLTEFTAGLAANTYPYKGHYHFVESLAKQPGEGLVQTIGGGDFTNFQVMAPPPPPAAKGQPAAAAPAADTVAFAESDINIQNSCNVDINTYSFSIDPAKPITITLKSSGALGLRIQGGVTDLLHQRQINDVEVQLDYDLAKLWTIIKPLMPPSQQQSLADLVITGKQQRTFKLSGSLPTDKPFNQAVASLVGGGYFTIDTLSTHGIDIAHLDLPIFIKDGVVRTVYPDQPEGSNAPQTATCNGGTIDLGIMAVDLRTDPMTLTMPTVAPDHPHYLFKNIALTKAVAKSVMVGFLSNPLFVDTSRSEGQVDVKIDQIQNVPLSALVNQSSPQNKGVAEVHYSVRQLIVGSPLLTVINGGQEVSATIDNADVKVAAGKLTEDTTMMISSTKPLRIWGTVILSNQTFAPMTISIPTGLLPAYAIPADVRSYLPPTVEVPMEGDMSHPKIRLDKMLPKLIADAAKQKLINSATGGGGGNNPLGNLLKGLGHH